MSRYLHDCSNDFTVKEVNGSEPREGGVIRDLEGPTDFSGRETPVQGPGVNDDTESSSEVDPLDRSDSCVPKRNHSSEGSLEVTVGRVVFRGPPK